MGEPHQSYAAVDAAADLSHTIAARGLIDLGEWVRTEIDPLAVQARENLRALTGSRFGDGWHRRYLVARALDPDVNVGWHLRHDLRRSDYPALCNFSSDGRVRRYAESQGDIVERVVKVVREAYIAGESREVTLAQARQVAADQLVLESGPKSLGQVPDTALVDPTTFTGPVSFAEVARTLWVEAAMADVDKLVDFCLGYLAERHAEHAEAPVGAYAVHMATNTTGLPVAGLNAALVRGFFSGWLDAEWAVVFMTEADVKAFNDVQRSWRNPLGLNEFGPVCPGDTPDLFVQAWEMSDALPDLELYELAAVARNAAA